MSVRIRGIAVRSETYRYSPFLVRFRGCALSIGHRFYETALILRITEHEPEKSAIKGNGLFFQEKEKRLSESKYSALAESHVPRFQERVGTSHLGYMIPNRMPWRLRARPSATLH